MLHSKANPHTRSLFKMGAGGLPQGGRLSRGETVRREGRVSYLRNALSPSPQALQPHVLVVIVETVQGLLVLPIHPALFAVRQQ